MQASGFKLVDNIFSVIAEDASLRALLGQMFSLCSRTDKAANVTIGSRFFCGTEIAEGSVWLRDALLSVKSAPGLVSMLSCPDGFHGAATVCGEIATFAWSEIGSGRIDVGIWQKDLLLKRETGRSVGADLVRKSNAAASIQSVLPPLLCDVFLQQEKLLIHSAALQCPNGTGALIVADGGGGKTTTAISMVRKGAKLLGDDLNMLEFCGDRVMAFGFPEMINLTDATIGFFEELQGVRSYVAEGSGTHKKVISPLDVYGADCMIDSCEIGAIYFVRVSGDGPSVERLPFSDALRRLMHAHSFANGQIPNEFAFSGLSDILASTPAYVVNTGVSPDFLGEWLVENCRTHTVGEK
ncbi:MAG: hypothetical protein KAH23_01475 [Kiritimatiellae bacterium]|nr:hypothetical protein [Kiritimatiellia bacterium]